MDQDIEFLELLYNDISLYKTKVSVLILWDFNARTASHHDYIVNDDDSYLPLHDDYVIDNTLFQRNSQEQKVCSRGKELLDLCISSRLRI